MVVSQVEAQRKNATESTINKISIEQRRDMKVPTDWTPSERLLCDLELLLSGALYPLTGFMCSDDYYSVLNKMTLSSGEVFPMPIVFPVPKNSVTSNQHWNSGENSALATASTSSENVVETSSGSQQTERDASSTDASERKLSSINIRDSVGVIVAELIVEDVYEPNLELEMEKVLGTTDMNHPYAKHMKEHYSECFYVGGRVIPRNKMEHFDFVEYRLTPEQVRESLAIFAQNKYENIVGFQTRNPMHRSHFELTVSCVQKVQRETNKKTLLLLTPAIGPTQPGDVPFHIRVQCYKRILPRYAERGIEAKLVLVPLAMRMAGPREAVWHAIIRRNYGCTHFIVGRDHAGPSAKTMNNSSFYKPYDAQEMLTATQEKLGIKPVFGQNMCYLQDLGQYVEESEVKANSEPISISGSELRNMLRNNEHVPDWYTFPEVASQLKKTFTPLHSSGVVIYFTGLPCSGKSTLASACKAALLERSTETRNVTLLDADIVRQHLSKGLGFSEQDRSANVRRIGYVASEVAKHRGICLVANIAPYEKDRTFNRQLTTTSGGTYVEVYVSTPLEVCERRDIKELFRQARLGIVKKFTGISDPYEIPKKPEVTLDSSTNLKMLVDQLLQYLEKEKLILSEK